METEERPPGTTFVGVCFDSGGWGGDLTGLLVVHEADGWKVAANHISSSEGWAARDIEYHFDKLKEPGDSFEWAGRSSVQEIEERFGWTGATTSPSKDTPEDRDGE